MGVGAHPPDDQAVRHLSRHARPQVRHKVLQVGHQLPVQPVLHVDEPPLEAVVLRQGNQPVGGGAGGGARGEEPGAARAALLPLGDEGAQDLGVG